MNDEELEDRLVALSDSLRESVSVVEDDMLPKNVLYLKDLVRYLDALRPPLRLPCVIWINSLVKNPFDIRKILSEQEEEKLADFLFECLGMCEKVSRAAIIGIAAIVNNLRLNGVLGTYGFNGTGATILGRTVANVVFFRFLKNLAKSGSSVDVDVDLRDGDSMAVKRMKMKVLSYMAVVSPEMAPSIFDKLVRYMSVDDVRLGWTLSKSIFRTMSVLNKKDIVTKMLSQLGTIQTREPFWMNCCTVISFCILDGMTDVNLKHVVDAMIFYDRKTFSRSSALREACLFMIWCWVRAGMDVDIRKVLIVATLDVSIQCRRAAVVVISEYVGWFGDVCKFSHALSVISCEEVKRLENAVNTVPRLVGLVPGLKDQVVDYLMCNLNCYSAQKRRVIAGVLSKLGDACICDRPLPAVLNTNTLHTLILYLKEKHKAAGNDAAAHDDCKVYSIVKNMSIGRNIVDHSDSDLITHDYLDLINSTCLMGGTEIDNVLFLLEKNYCDNELLKVCRELSNESAPFSNKVYSELVRRNSPSLILANAANVRYRDEIGAIFHKNTKSDNIEVRLATLKALKFSNLLGGYADFLKKSLEDYSVDHRGDIGAKIRIEGLTCIESLELFEKYFIRYFVDKSKHIRDALVWEAASALERTHLVPFLFRSWIERGNLVDMMSSSSAVSAFLRTYFDNYRSLFDENLLGHDDIHFKSAMASFGPLQANLKREFMVGAIATLKNSDASLSKFIFNMLIERADNITCIVKSLLEPSGKIKRENVLALYLVSRIVKACVEDARVSEKVVESASKLKSIDYEAMMTIAISPFVKELCLQIIDGYNIMEKSYGDGSKETTTSTN